ncbi:hypothetical protein [Puia dinghuensis]|uniref:Uncharacterized protein n=1 Tax=Puia dinghuensis TaxID=1792502 RepID=A0A8J2U8D2_9BACT|nr:hypothetical protein [Puia dinghuensis]GGA85416.1 hypothetical protein GCM10011511_05570 [Puia dinghuensis]
MSNTDLSREAVHLQARQLFLLNKIAEVPIPAGQSGDTFWEELNCIGFNPAQSRLEATVSIKQTTGYSGGQCTFGSTEYIRFFVDWGSGYVDAGLTSFSVFDVPETPPGPGIHHPLSYMVYILLDDAQHRRICLSPVLPKVKAILSWNSVPNTDPNQSIVYGNAKEAQIQLNPRPWLFIDFLQAQKIAIDMPLLKQFDLHQPIPEAADKTADFIQLQTSYTELKIPAHRSLYKVVYPALKPLAAPAAAVPGFQADYFKKMDFNWESLAAFLLQSQGNTDFEEVTCVGLNADRDTLGAVIHVKKQAGYSGGLCWAGSVEYVAFWADWNNNGSFDSYLGTAQVGVHDITGLSADGLYYCVSLPLDLASHLKACQTQNVVGIRAVLSWDIPPSTTNSNELNYWGNRLDVRVLLRALETIGGNIGFHYHDIGSVPLNQINNGYGFASPVITPFNNRPWGADIRIAGRFNNSGPAGTVDYRVEFCSFDSLNDADWQPVTLSQIFYLYNPGTGYYDNVVTQNTTDGWFHYLEDFSGGTVIDEYYAMLATWHTAAVPVQGSYYIRVIYTTDHTHATFVRTAAVNIIVNNHQYSVNSAFHNYMSGGATLDTAYDVDMIFNGAGGCISVTAGTSFAGLFRAVHTYFAEAQLYVLPANSGAILSSGGITTPPGGTLERDTTSLVFSGFPGEPWTMDTSKMAKCGYVLVLQPFERTIYSNDLDLPYTILSIGFAIV